MAATDAQGGKVSGQGRRLPGAGERGQALLGVLGLLLALSVLALGLVRLEVATTDRGVRDAQEAEGFAAAQAVIACAQAAVQDGRSPTKACRPGGTVLPRAFAYRDGQARLTLSVAYDDQAREWTVSACAAFWPRAAVAAPVFAVQVQEALPRGEGGAAAWRTEREVARC